MILAGPVALSGSLGRGAAAAYFGHRTDAKQVPQVSLGARPYIPPCCTARLGHLPQALRAADHRPPLPRRRQSPSGCARSWHLRGSARCLPLRRPLQLRDPRDRGHQPEDRRRSTGKSTAAQLRAWLRHKSLPQDDPEQCPLDISKGKERLAWERTVRIDEALEHTIAYLKELLSTERRVARQAAD